MVDAYLQMASLLVVGFLFGGMLLFSAGFAAFLFKYLPLADVRMLLRKAFPPFYLFVILSSGSAAALMFIFDPFSSTLMAVVALTTIPARQVLMPAINQATDSGLKKRFLWLHGFSVVLTLGHIVLAAVVLIQLGSR
jgi:hypothetical protein